MRPVFEIGKDLELITEYLTDNSGEITDDEIGQAIEAFFDSLIEERDEKLSRLCYAIKQLTVSAAAREEEAKRIKALADSDAKAAERLKARIEQFVTAHKLVAEKKPLKLGNWTIAIQGNGGPAPLAFPDVWEKNPSSAPAEFLKLQLDSSLIRAALESGEEIEGCELKPRGKHLRIR